MDREHSEQRKHSSGYFVYQILLERVVAQHRGEAGGGERRVRGRETRRERAVDQMESKEEHVPWNYGFVTAAGSEQRRGRRLQSADCDALIEQTGAKAAVFERSDQRSVRRYGSKVL